MKQESMTVNGTRYPLMSWKNHHKRYPPLPDPKRDCVVPPAPDELRKPERIEELKKWLADACAKSERDFAALWKKRKEEHERNPMHDIQIELHFPTFTWKGGGVGEKISVADMLAGEINSACNLVLKNGRVIHGRTEPLSDEKIIANKARLDMSAMWAKGDESNKPRRKVKDPRPLPPPDVRRKYTNTIWDLIPTEHSNRKLAKQVIAWAHEQGKKDPNGFARWKIIGESALQKEAGSLRKDWAKEKAKRRKRR